MRRKLPDGPVMYDSFIYSVNSVFPIFIVVFLGWFLVRIKFITADFASTAERLVFRVALPAMLFSEVASAEFSAVFDGRFLLFCCGGIFTVFALLCLIVPFFIKSNDKRGAFIQGVYRSNFAILGVPLAKSMFGEEGVAQIALLMPFTILMFNVFAVLILTVYAPVQDRPTPLEFIKRILLNIITNPLIIAVTAGLPFMLTPLTLPTAAAKTFGVVADMVTPLALICIGAGFRFEALKGRIGMAIIAAFFKVIAVPAAAVTIAVALGFRGVRLGAILILFGAPTAVTSYIMAKNMKSDHELASQIIILTTLVCAFTLFIGTFILKNFGLFG